MCGGFGQGKPFCEFWTRPGLVAEAKDDEELDKLSLYGLKLDDGQLESYRHDGSEIAFARVTIGDDLR